MVRVAVFTAIFAGCAGVDEPGSHFVVPFDGQTRVAPTDPLRVRAADLAVPPDYPVGEIVSVVDLQTGGFVEGTLDHDGLDLTFTPVRPWRADRRYAWTVRVPDDLVHGPHFEASEDLLASAVFDTSDRVDVLAAGNTGAGTVCLVLSTDPDASFEPSRVTVDDVDVDDATFTPYAQDEWDPSETVPDLQTAATVVCMQTETEIAVGARLRVWTTGDAPSLVEVQDESPRALLVALHRGGT